MISTKLILRRLVIFPLAVCFITSGLNPTLQAAPEYAAVKPKLIQPRDGLGNVLTKFKDGQPVKIAYLGGSITAADGWRVKTRDWFANQFPDADVEEIHAAIGGTGSDLGVFRLQRDALHYKPDLLFVEFAVNDGGASPQRIWQAMEGIVRQTWAHNSRIDICFVYTFRTSFEEPLRKGECPQSISAMEMLADHYGIPSINFAMKIVELEQAGKLIFKSDQPTEAGVVRFSSDGVHPLDEGHQIYTKIVAEAVTQMEKTSQPQDHQPKLSTTFVEDNWQAAKMVPIEQSMLSPEWKQLPDDASLARSFAKRMGTLWETKAPGSTLTFKFRGSTAKLYDLLGPDGGQVWITVDGNQRDKPVPRFDSYCTYHRIATLSVANGLDSDLVHTVSIKVDEEQPDRQSVAFRLKDPDVELKSPKFHGTNIRVGQILILGDLVE